MTPETALDLHPARLPADYVSLNGHDLLTAFGIGLLLAGLVLTLLHPLLRPRRRPPRLADQIAVAATLPPAERQLALVRMLAQRGTPLPDDLRQALYAGTAYDPARIEALLRTPPGPAHG